MPRYTRKRQATPCCVTSGHTATLTVNETLTALAQRPLDGVRTPSERAYDMADDQTGDWLTYEQVAERLSVTPEAVRQKAIRGRWHRSRGNDGKARVRLPEGRSDGVRTVSARPNTNAVRTPSERVSVDRLFKALEDHVETLKKDLAARDTDLAAAKAERESLKTDLSAERGEREAARAHAAALEESLDAEREKLDAERQRAGEAIKAHLDLTELIATERARPWWKRLVS